MDSHPGSIGLPATLVVSAWRSGQVGEQLVEFRLRAGRECRLEAVAEFVEREATGAGVFAKRLRSLFPIRVRHAQATAARLR